MKEVAIITGASSGLGKYFAKHLDNIGLSEIWLIARREKLLKKLSESMKTECKVFSIDLTDMNNIKSLEKELKNGDFSIKYLVNNAGFGLMGEFKNLDIEKQLDMIDLNIKALIKLTYIALDYIVEGGKIIQVASSAGFLPIKNFAVYAATKAFVVNFSNALNLELKKRKITVTAVCPGPVKTEFFKIASGGKEPKIIYEPENVVKKALKDAEKGKLNSIYGFFMNVLIFSSNFIPRKLKATITSKSL